MAQEVRLEPVGRVVGGRDEVRDDAWAPVAAVVELDPARFGTEAVAGLGAFSHLEVVFLFDRVDPAAVEVGARHPRGNRAWPRVGHLRPAREGPAQPPRRVALPARGGRRAAPRGRGPRRRGRDARARRQAVAGRARPAGARSASPPGRSELMAGTGRPGAAEAASSRRGGRRARRSGGRGRGSRRRRSPPSRSQATWSSTLAQRSCAWRCSDAAHSSSVVPSARDRALVPGAEVGVEERGRAGDLLGVDEDPARRERVVDAGEQRALARRRRGGGWPARRRRRPTARRAAGRRGRRRRTPRGRRARPGLVEHRRGAVEERDPGARVRGEHAPRPAARSRRRGRGRAAGARGAGRARRRRSRRRRRRAGRAGGGDRRSPAAWRRRSSRQRCPS